MSLIRKIFGNKPKTSARVAKERLQLIIAHERDVSSRTLDFLPELQRELMSVIARYIPGIQQNSIRFSQEQQGSFEVIEVNIVLPDKP